MLILPITLIIVRKVHQKSRILRRPYRVYWQASQSGLSRLQNFISVAGNSATADALVGTIAVGAATGPAAMDVFGAAALCAPPELDTAFNSPPLPVDFSALVAPMVRR